MALLGAAAAAEDIDRHLLEIEGRLPNRPPSTITSPYSRGSRLEVAVSNP
jgi:hypothetical protein